MKCYVINTIGFRGNRAFHIGALNEKLGQLVADSEVRTRIQLIFHISFAATVYNVYAYHENLL